MKLCELGEGRKIKLVDLKSAEKMFTDSKCTLRVAEGSFLNVIENQWYTISIIVNDIFTIKELPGFVYDEAWIKEAK